MCEHGEGGVGVVDKQKYYVRAKKETEDTKKQISNKQASKQQSSNIRFITRNKFAFIPYLYALKIVHTNLHAYYKYVIYVPCLRSQLATTSNWRKSNEQPNVSSVCVVATYYIQTRAHTTIAICLLTILLRVFWFARSLSLSICLLSFFVASIALPMYEQVHESNYSKFYIRTRGTVVLWPWILCDAFFLSCSYLLPSTAMPCPYIVAVVTFIACEKQRNTLSNLNCNVFKYFWNIKIPYSSEIVNVKEVHALLFICDTAYTVHNTHKRTHAHGQRKKRTSRQAS